MKRHAPAADRNRTPILDVLRPLLPDGVLVLEIASGSGQHVVHFAANLPRVTFQPSDAEPGALASIEAHRAESGLPNILPPLRLDASATTWPILRAEAIVCINMIHISPFACTEGLFAGANRVLPPGGLLYLYGPYRFSGAFTAPSNEAFDASLRAQNPTWGVRDVDDLAWLAHGASFLHENTIPMPANNHSLIFRKRA